MWPKGESRCTSERWENKCIKAGVVGGIDIERCGACGGKTERKYSRKRERALCAPLRWKCVDGHLSLAIWWLAHGNHGDLGMQWFHGDVRGIMGITSELGQEWEGYCHKSQNLEIKIYSKHSNQTTQMVQKRLHETCSSSRIGHDTSLCVFRYILQVVHIHYRFTMWSHHWFFCFNTHNF